MNLSEKYAIVQKYSRHIGGIYLSTCDLDSMAGHHAGQSYARF